MRAILQRVHHAEVRVDDAVTGAIDQGLLVFVGCGEGDTEDDADQLIETLIHLRIFADDDGKMNRSLIDVDGQLLVVSQFTLYADTSRGRRPSFMKAMDPGPAEALYDTFVERLEDRGIDVESGMFGEMMDVELCNDGPVTITLDTDEF